MPQQTPQTQDPAKNHPERMVHGWPAPPRTEHDGTIEWRIQLEDAGIISVRCIDPDTDTPQVEMAIIDKHIKGRVVRLGKWSSDAVVHAVAAAALPLFPIPTPNMTTTEGPDAWFMDKWYN